MLPLNFSALPVAPKTDRTTVRNLRIRYGIALGCIALLITASFITMQHVISAQKNFSVLVNLAGHQSGLANRIAYFSSLMATTKDESEFNMARSQVGRTIHKMEHGYQVLRKGDPLNGIPNISNDQLKNIYESPMVGLDDAIANFLDQATVLYNTPHEQLTSGSSSYIYITTYGPHALEPLLDAVVDEFQAVANHAINRIEHFETAIWLTTLLALILEILFIFHPLEGHVSKALSTLRKSVDELSRTRVRLLAAQELAKVGDWELDLTDGTITWSDQVYDICGLSKDALVLEKDNVMPFIHEDDQRSLKAALLEVMKNRTPVHLECRIVRGDGEIRTVYQHIAVKEMNDTQALAIVGTVQDITDRKDSENQIQKLALYDPLTGVANRRLLKEKLQHAVATSRRNQRFGAVLMLDLDNFKTLNDTKGHDVGDSMLIEVTQRLQNNIRETDTVARLGGDEFVVILEWLGANKARSQQQAMDIAEKIRFSLNQPYILGQDDHRHNSSVSIGVVVFSGRRQDVSEILKRADLAMYEAKDLGRNRSCLFSKIRQNLVDMRNEMANNLKLALEKDEFSLYLQPQISASAELGGAEALLRWFPPGSPSVPPDDFIPVAEQTGLIIPIGEWVLRKTCMYLAELEKYQLHPDFAIAVNISARQFADDGFMAKVDEIVRTTGVDTSRLKFELTESCIFHNLERGQVLLKKLKAMGIEVELDDFGTGYSSLNTLKNLPFSTVKLDKSLIRDIDVHDTHSQAIVRAAVTMARAMSIKIVAEGVETVEQKDFLISEGCDLLQGYLFARPMPFSDFKEYTALHNLQHSPEFADKVNQS